MAKQIQETVRVKLNCSRAGHTYDDQGRQAGAFSQNSGDVVDMPTAEAQRYFQKGLASPHTEPNHK